MANAVTMTTLTTGEAKFQWLKDAIEKDDGARFIFLVGKGGEGKTSTVRRVHEASQAARDVPWYVYAECACRGRDPRTWKDAGTRMILEVLTPDWENTLKELFQDDASVRVAFFA
jgi:hypothetical protein